MASKKAAELACCEDGEGGWILAVEGTFDVTQAWRLRDAISRFNQATRVVLDFTRVREWHDFALAVLLHALTMMKHPRLLTRGLREHQLAILRHLGIDPDALVRAQPVPA